MTNKSKSKYLIGIMLQSKLQEVVKNKGTLYPNRVDVAVSGWYDYYLQVIQEQLELPTNI